MQLDAKFLLSFSHFIVYITGSVISIFKNNITGSVIYHFLVYITGADIYTIFEVNRDRNLVRIHYKFSYGYV